MELRPHQAKALQELRNGSEEEWVEVRDFPDYLISNYGRVYSCKKDRLLRPGLSGNSYLTIQIWEYSICYGKSIHRLVAEAFVPGWDVDLQVNHIDGDKLNNYESNLEWVTPKENIRHAMDMGLHKSHPGPRKAIIVNNTGEIFESITACAEFYGTRPGTIARVLSENDILKSWKGLTFSYYDE